MPKLRSPRQTPPPIDSLSLPEARRIALAAQGFGAERQVRRLDRRHLRGVLDKIALLQIDSVNVLVRSHYLPLFARLGPYAPTLLDRAAWGGRTRHLFEYWGHEASLLPVETHALLRWRMARAERLDGIYGELADFVRRRGAYVEEVFAEVARRGPIAAGEVVDSTPRQRGSWWSWSDAKRALEWLFWAGRVTTATRRGFERVYDLPERVLPADVLAAPTPPPAEAQRALIGVAARALGVATERDLRDYFRLGPEAARTAVGELVDEGELIPVAVEGWSQAAYLSRTARAPRRISAQALLSPFDSLVWERARTERLFGFRYRLEIYTPAERRVHGYYVLPFLLDERLVARVDLKADRARGRLLALAAHLEVDNGTDRVADALTEELRMMASWLGLERIAVSGSGELVRALRRRARRTPLR